MERKRRSNIYPRGKNSWRIVLSTGKDAKGKRRRLTETVHGPKQAAKSRLKELRDLKDKGIITPQARITLAEHLTNWLGGYVSIRCRSRTIDSYESIARIHLIPALGHYQLRQLNHRIIQDYYSAKMAPSAEKRLAARTVAKHHRLLSQALKYAMKEGRLAYNPCSLADVPQWEPREMQALDENEAALFLDQAASSRFYPVYYTAINTGLRQAELCGLTWRDINTEATTDKDGNVTYGTVSVNHILYKRRGVCELRSPKTARSRRTVKMTQNLAEFLKDYKATQEMLYWKATDWRINKPLPPDYFVFGFLDKPCSPSMLSHDFATIAQNAGLKGVRFHDLRHTFISLMLAASSPPNVVSAIAGHASVAFTLQTYGHVLSGMQEKAMSLLNDILPPGIRK